MKNIILTLSFITFYHFSGAQNGYKSEMKAYRKEYIDSHEVVVERDKMNFRFFHSNKKYRVVARFKKIHDSARFIMKTSGKVDKAFFRYGIVTFHLYKKQLQLTVYQSISLLFNTKYKNYLFIPFTDKTSGEQSYGGGKYIDITIDEIKGDKVIIDFNKAYNPYCAYATGYNCPIPPMENDLPVFIKAGEKNFSNH